MGQLEDLNVFVRVVEAGGISKAAEQLGVAKSGVSRRLAALENRLGTPLITRTTRSLSLTTVGREYYQRALKLISDAAELDALAMDEGASLSGLLRVAAPLSFGLLHLSPAIDAFICEHPGLTIDVDFSDHKVDLVEQGMDLAIRIADLEDSTLQARRICPIQLVLCASPAYLEERGVPESPADLAQHEILGYKLGDGPAIKLSNDRPGRHLANPALRVVANNGDFLRDMAVAGHGIAVLPTFIVWKSLAAGELVRVLDSHQPAALNAWAVYPRTRYLSLRARRFIDFIVERFGEEPFWDAGNPVARPG